MKQLFYLFCLLSVLFMTDISCKNKDFPDVKPLSNYENTVFSAYPEKIHSSNQNQIYAASFLFAWDEIKQSLKNEIKIKKSQYSDLYYLNKSTYHLTSLDKSEYTSSVRVSQNVICAEAYFKKTLKFEKEFQSFSNSLIFNEVPVQSFGLWGDDYERSHMIKVLYYENDDDFIIKLVPEDPENEILLYKVHKKGVFSLMNLWEESFSKISIGKERKQNPLKAWRYQFDEEDKAEIPKLRFNIETNFSEFEQAELFSKEVKYKIERAYQRTAFVLNEKGAIVESEAEIDIASAPPDEEIQEPKRLILDKPFLVILKRTDSDKPYFMMWVANSELME